MKRRRLTQILALAALTAAGALAALSFAPTAKAWDIFHLPPGWTYEDVYNVLPGNCEHAVVIRPPGQLGPSFCLASTSWQADLDAWVTANYTAPTTATTTTGAATTAQVVTTAPPETTTAAPAPPPPVPPPVVTDTTSAQISALEARIALLEQQIAALSLRVDRVALAGDASWLAYQQSIEKGDPADVAAGIARGTWLNAVYGLGSFAP